MRASFLASSLLCLGLAACEHFPAPSPEPAPKSDQALIPKEEEAPRLIPEITALALRVQFEAWQNQKTQFADYQSPEEKLRVRDLERELFGIGSASVTHQSVPLRRFVASGKVSLQFKGKILPLQEGVDYHLRVMTTKSPLRKARCPLLSSETRDGQRDCALISGGESVSSTTLESSRPSIASVVLVDQAHFSSWTDTPILRDPGATKPQSMCTIVLNTERLPKPLQDPTGLRMEDKKSLFLSLDLTIQHEDFEGLNLIAEFPAARHTSSSHRTLATFFDRQGPILGYAKPQPESLDLIGTLSALHLALHSPEPPKADLRLLIFDGAVGREFYARQHPEELKSLITPASVESSADPWLGAAKGYQGLIDSLLSDEGR